MLLDIRRPGIDGHTVLDHLKGSPHPPAIIIVSGHRDEQEARELLRRGAFDYVTKPFDLNYLTQAIAAAAGTELPWVEGPRRAQPGPPPRAVSRPDRHLYVPA